MSRPTVTVAEATDILKVKSRSNVMLLINTGKLSAHLDSVGNRPTWRIDRESLLAYKRNRDERKKLLKEQRGYIESK